MRKIHGLLLILAVILTASSCEDKYKDANDGIYAEINTSKGTMFAKLYHEAAPATVANFVALAEGEHPLVADSLKGKPFYNGLIFHRVIEDFMIQGGDITGTGSGNIGYKFDQEINDTLNHDAKGILSMANAGPNTNGSQFFIMHKERPQLDGRYNVFGKVMEGLEVIDSIATVTTDGRDRPLDSIVINEINIIRKGKAARKWDAPKVFKEQKEKAEQKAEEERRIATERRERAPAVRKAKAEELAALEKKAKELPGGVKIYTIEKGTGGRPADKTRVMINYSGFFEDGRLFDSSYLTVAQDFDNVDPRKLSGKAYRPMPVIFDPAAGMVQGFKDAMLSMEYGDKIVAYIPSDLAYGERGAGNVIPPNSDLIFEMEMMEPVEIEAED
ncbi:peptidylprolyl isomerase [Nonlabens ponticola]|uniref:peptidylprolyl isomerase n=1 Tax=Nonlabens ponticola TaxID=2496866 RepID=A0A3S9MYR8_9FLAO|nr:peptidylprolyl isomerase [Nonlabens ponticola]AZQ44395.1 peptidylprolyl isomerase [Nonlabens ponticola]